MATPSQPATAPGQPAATPGFSGARTAAEIAQMLSQPGAAVSRQAVNKRLAGIPASEVLRDWDRTQGNAANAWHWDALPSDLREDLTHAAETHGYRDEAALWSNPPAPASQCNASPAPAWQPAVPRAEIAPEEWQRAERIRDVLLPVLRQLHDPAQSAESLHLAIATSYEQAFRRPITPDYARKLLARTLAHDSGREDWNQLAIYLPDHPRRRAVAPLPGIAAELEQTAPEFPHLKTVLQTLRNPAAPSPPMAQAIWTAACRDLTPQLGESDPSPDLVRQVCDLIYEYAPRLCRSRALYPKQLHRKLSRWKQRTGEPHALKDMRRENGETVSVSQKDIEFLSHAAAFLHGGRLDEAWWENYEQLSTETRAHYQRTWRCPTTVRNLVNPELLKALTALHQGKKYLRRYTGFVKRRRESLPAMDSATMDDCTLNLEVEHSDGSGSLIQPQLIVCQDFRSAKIIGWAVAAVKGPSAQLACDAALDAFAAYGVPHNLWLENGQVFGKALMVNGKEDSDGRTIVAGLEAYGCKIRHFKPASPTSKGELEKTFDLLQRRLEPHPGYTGRLQQKDAPDEFKREGVEIRSGRVPASKHRYTWNEFTQVLAETIIAKYNAKPQRGALNGLSPNQAFEKFQDATNPPIVFAPELRWMLANARYRVTVKIGGVSFRHNSETLQVRGAPLTDFIGRELWALVDRKDDSLVTFMQLDFTNPFTMEICRETDRDEAATSPGSGVLASELGKIADHQRAIETEYHRLQSQFGNPRVTLLQQRRAKATPAGARPMEVPPELARTGETMQEQRKEIKERRAARALSADTQRRRGEALEREARRLYEQEQEANDPEFSVKSSAKKTYTLKPFGSGKREYVDYLVKRLTEFRSAGKSFGQKFAGGGGSFSPFVTAKIARSQLGFDIYEESRFEEVCNYLKSKISATIIGKRNAAKGHRSWHEFEPALTES